MTRHWTAEAPWEGYGVSIMDVFDHWFLAAQSRSIHRIGAPVDFLYDFDLNDKDTQKYKLFLFPNLFYLTDFRQLGSHQKIPLSQNQQLTSKKRDFSLKRSA